VQAVTYCIAFATVEEIETLNILGATYLAMNRAIAGLSVLPMLTLIDGNRNEGIDIPSRCIVGGDGKCASIAAASILAKVTRDRYMLEMAERYPIYGFEKHKGYGTAEHYKALREYGPSEIHRRSFLKKMH
jgi:ribonuclease HII